MNSTKGKMATAFKTLICKKSFQKITISDISNESGMTRENFYYHFRDKYDIVRWIFEKEIFEKLPSAEEDFEKWVNNMIRMLAADGEYYRRIIKGMGKDSVRQYFFECVKSRIQVLISDSMDDSIWNMRKEKEEFVTGFFTEAFVEFFMNYLLEQDSVSTELVERNMHFLFDKFLMFVRIQKD